MKSVAWKALGIKYANDTHSLCLVSIGACILLLNCISVLGLGNCKCHYLTEIGKLLGGETQKQQ
jgi:hypothetical protein